MDFTKLQAFTRYFTDRYKGKLVYLEGVNEPDGLGYFTGCLAMAIEWQKATYSGSWNFRDTHGIRVISAPVVLGDKGFPYLEGLMNTGGFNVVGVHYYDSRLRPSDFEGNLWRGQVIIARKGGSNHKDDPIFITEWGWNGPIRFPDLPPAVQVAQIEEHVSIASRYAAALVNFAYDDPDHGWQGNTAVEAAMNTAQARFQ